MIHKKQIKIILDVIMTVALLFLMAFQVTGDEYHEWIGAGMLVLFVVHNCLNFGWYKAVFKGRYSLQRILRTVVNLMVFVAIILTAYSGIVMSRYVFDFLPINGGMATARKLHLAYSYWAFVMMSVHLGMHWSMMIDKKLKDKKLLVWLFRAVAAAAAIYGAVLFGQGEIFHNMFMQNEFALLDFETPGALVILQNLAMMSTWVFVGHYLTNGVVKLSVSFKKNKKESIYGLISILAAITMIFACIFATPKKQ